MSDTTSDPNSQDDSGALDAGSLTSPEYQAQMEAGGGGQGALPQPQATQPNTTVGIPQNFQQLAAYQQQLMAARQTAEAQHKAYFDPDALGPDADPSKMDMRGALNTATASTSHGALHDFGNRLWASTLQTGEAAEGVVSAAARAMGASPDTVAWIESQKRDVENHISATLDDLSPKGKEALQASIFGGKDAQGNAVPTPGQAGWGRYIAGAAADAIPSIALAMLPGGIAANVAKAATFGALDAGGAYNEMIKQIDGATPDQLGKSPVYQHLREQGMSDQDARKELLAQLAPAMVAEHFAAGAAGGAGLGSALAGGLVPKGMSLIKRALIGAGEGAATMGGQAAADNAIDQQFQGQTTGKTFDPSDTAWAAAEGALGGAVFGAAGGALHGGHTDASVASDQTDAAGQTPPLALTYDKKPWATPTFTEQPNEAPTRGSNRVISMPDDSGVPPDIQAAVKQALPPDPAQAAPAPSPAPAPEAPQAQAAPAPSPAPAPEAPQAQAAPEAPPTTTTVGTQPPQNLADVQAQVAAQKAPWKKPTVTEEARPAPPAAQPVAEPTPVVAPPQQAPAPAEAPPAPAVARPAVEEAASPAPAQEPAGAPAPQTEAPPERTSPPVAEPENQGEIPAPAGNTQRRAVSNATDHPRDGGEGAQEKPTPAPAAPSTSRAKLDAKMEAARQARALRKAQQAKPGEVAVPTARAYVAPENEAAPTIQETRPAPEPKAAPKATREDTMTALRDAMARVSTKVIKVRKGNDVAKAVSMAMREIGELIDDKDESAGAVHDAIEKWAKPTVIPGTDTRRVDVADDLMRLMTGKPVGAARMERAAEEARLEAARQPSVMEKEGVGRQADVEASHAKDLDREITTDSRAVDLEDVAPPATVESKGEPSQGVQDFGAEKTRSDATTDRERIASDHLQRAMEGRATAREIAQQFDWQPSKSGGRPPRQSLRTFADYLDHRIAKTEKLRNDPGERARLLKKLADTQNDDGLNRELMREMAKTSPETLARLKELRAELDDPVRAAVEREAKPPVADEPKVPEPPAPPKDRDDLHAKIKARIAERETEAEAEASKPAKAQRPLHPPSRRPVVPPDPSASRYVKASEHPTINRALEDRLIRNGGEAPLHDMLDMIASHFGEDSDGAPLRALAMKLKDMAPNITVRSDTRADQLGLFPASRMRGFFAMFVTPNRSREGTHIILNLSDTAPNKPNSLATSVMHEALHATTFSYLDHLQLKDPENRQYKAMRLIGQELINRMNAEQIPELSEIEEAYSRYATKGIQWLHELHTAIMSSPYVQEAMKRTPVSTEFRAAMAKLGYNPGEPSRSLWRHFTDWTRRALGLGPADSTSGQTLFDHVMAPSQDIMDAAHAFNQAASTPTDPTVRAMGSSVAEATTVGRGRDVLDEIGRRLDLGAVADKARQSLLQASTLDSITKWNRALFNPSDRLAMRGNPLDDFRRAQESTANTTRQIFSKWSDRVNSIIDRVKGREELAQLMNDATIANVKLGTSEADANAHVNPDVLKGFQDRFAALTPADQQTYKDRRDHYAAMLKVEREAQRRALVSMALPDATPEQQARLADVVKSLRSIEAFLKSPDDSDLAQAFGNEWQRNRQLLRGIAKIQKLGFVKGDYFPLRRYGDYVIHYGDRTDPEQYGVEMFERKHEAEARRRELLSQGHDDVSQVQLKRDSYGRGNLPNTQFADEIEHAVGRNPALRNNADEIGRIVDNILIEHAQRSELARTRARRRGIKGASIDAARTDATEFLAHANRMGYLEHGAARSQALAQMRLVADDLGIRGRANDQIRAQSVTQELQQRAAAMSGPDGGVAALARKATGLGFVQSLMSPSHAITSSIEAHTNSTSILGARHGAPKAIAAITKALADVSPTLVRQGFRASMKAMGQGLKAADWDLSRAAQDRLVKAGADAGQMSRLFAAADAAGLIDHTYDRDLRDAARSGIATTTVGKAWGRFVDMNAIGAHSVDVANRSAILKAAFDLELEKSGGSEAVAIQRAIDTLRDAVPNYNYSNKARIATTKGALGQFAGPLTQFKQYGIHMYGVMANMLREGLHGADAQTRREARKAFAGVLATHALMAGSLTLLSDPLRLIGGLYDWVTGATGPHDYENDVRGFLSDTFGPELGEIIARGAPHAVGIDIHRRVGLANLMELPDLDSFDSKGILKALATMATGAAGEDAATMIGGMSKALRGDIQGGLTDLVPRVFRDPLKAMALADHGVVDTRGRPGLSPDKIGLTGVLAQAAGFQPSSVSEYREGRAAVQEAMQEAKTERGSLMNGWLAADGDDRAAVMTQIRQFNAAHPGEAITMPQLVAAMRQRAQAAMPGTAQNFGLRLPAKDAAQLAQAGHFANIGS